MWDTEQEPTQEQAQEPEQEHATRESTLELLRDVRERRKQMEGTGRYVFLPTEALTLRAEAYYNLYVEDVIKMLVSSGITETETVERVVQDYCFTLMGFYDLIALPLTEQVRVCNTVKPWRLYLTEQYGLNLLFGLYFYNVRTASDYFKQFKLLYFNSDEEINATPTEKRIEGKRNYLNTLINRFASGTAPMLAAGYNWIRKNVWEKDGVKVQIVEPLDFAGVEPELANKFFAYVEVFAGVDEYVNYYYISKYALNATPDELKEIEFPPVLGTFEQAREYAERVGLQRYKNLQRKAADVEKMIDAETVEETERVRKKITSEPAEPQETVRIPETFALLGSRDVYASVDGTPQMTKGILPIQAFITDYMTRHNLTEQVTPRTVEKVIEGINLLQRLHNVRPVGGYYTFRTNITEFSELIGFKDANQTEKLEIMRALQVLDGLFLAVWRSDGCKAVRVFTLQQIGVSGVYTGQLVLQVNADVMKGRPNLISFGDFDAIRKAAKGRAENHFRYQILSKGQKEENALLNEVFGYDTLLKEIELSGGTAEDIVKAKRNIDKHKSRDKRRVATWFVEYRQKGWLLSYTYTRNGKGEYVYKWRRGNIPQETDTTTEAPEQQ